MPLTTEQVRIIIVTERVSSILSLCGAALVVFTFTFGSKFRKPINRLVFYATWGNVLANVATLMSTAGIEAGQDSPLCQIQAFLIQWFMPADALWTFAMACNVYLSFFKSYDSDSLRRLEWKYFVACYSIPFFPACAYLFIQTAGRGRVYGSALLWCWVSLKWELLRVVTFYGPVWLVILTTFAIYIKVGVVVFRWRSHLVSMEFYPYPSETRNGHSSVPVTKETEILVHRSYTVTRPNIGNMSRRAMMATNIVPFDRNQSRRKPRDTSYTTVQRSGGVDPNKATLKYCKCALLFFIALLITWVPSTVNRIWTLVYPKQVIFGMNFAAALVLPLQGFWNSVIYFATSVYAVQSLRSRLRKLLEPKKHEEANTVVNRHQHGTIIQPVHETPVRLSLNRNTPGFSSQSELVGTA